MKTRRVFYILISFLLLLSLAACGQSKRSEQEIVEELVLYYGRYGSEAADETAGLLKELKSVNKKSAAKWEKILDYWEYANNEIEINYDVLPDGLPTNDELCLVALGFKLNPDGTMQEELVERLKVVLASAEKYPNAYIVCTGGGTAANNKSVTEAGRMADWLVEHGVAKDRIFVEDRSITTAQNAMYTYEILRNDAPQVTDIAIISSGYHICTGALFFEACFILNSEKPDKLPMEVVTNAAYKAPRGELSMMFQAGGLIELSGDVDQAFDIYHENYNIHELPTLKTSE